MYDLVPALKEPAGSWELECHLVEICLYEMAYDKSQWSRFGNKTLD